MDIMKETNLPDDHYMRRPWRSKAKAITWAAVATALMVKLHGHLPWFHDSGPTAGLGSPYGPFPVENDPFQFIPCTNKSLPPALDDPDHQQSWAALYDPNPDNWSWGESSSNSTDDPLAGRGIYMCGYLDVPLDYLNETESRIVRLAVTKYQVSGLTRLDSANTPTRRSHKTERTIIIEPGGPGGSGTSYVWRAAEDVTKRFSDGQFDVLGWDPRGVNISLPAASCFPHDSLRDRWSMFTGQYREVVSDPMHQLEIADAMSDAVFHACRQRFGDFGRFISTASVARDVDEIRKALGEDEVTGYFVSYGTGIGQTYANMFPHSVGRLILDGTEYVRDHRLLGGFGWTALDNGTDAWHDGFLGECINAGPERCALVNPLNSEDGPVTIDQLEARMSTLLQSLITRPMPAYTDTEGPSLITYSALVGALYEFMYNPINWPLAARMLSELEAGNATLAATQLEQSWSHKPEDPSTQLDPFSFELGDLVICADSYDAPPPEDGLRWWGELWQNMTSQSWIAGNSRFFSVIRCRYYTKYWSPTEVYRGDLNHTLKTPVLLIAETHDPATPLRNGRRLLEEMGSNARLVVHHGYGHSSNRDRSDCTDQIGKAYVLNGTLPSGQETNCFANKKPYIQAVEGHDGELS